MKKKIEIINIYEIKEHKDEKRERKRYGGIGKKKERETKAKYKERKR